MNLNDPEGVNEPTEVTNLGLPNASVITEDTFWMGNFKSPVALDFRHFFTLETTLQLLSMGYTSVDISNAFITHA